MSAAHSSSQAAGLLSDKKIHTLRRLVQAGFGLFCLYSGYRFYQYFLWVTSRSETYVPRPPSVEAFLPISALVNLKRLVMTGHFDTIHPAGLIIFLAALFIGLLLRKGFCGWICPVGFASNLVESFSRRFRLLVNPPRWIDYPLLSLKYILLFFFSYLILLKMDIAAIENFNSSTYNLVVDSKMLLFFLHPSSLSMWILIFLVAISFVLKNFWCRYLCPYGALLGILALFSPIRVNREEANCIDCKKCDRICPGNIQVSRKQAVRTPECIGCGECVAVCPARECLSLAGPQKRRLPLVTLPSAILAVFFLFYGWAIATGHWHSSIPPDTMKQIYSATRVEDLEHP